MLAPRYFRKWRTGGYGDAKEGRGAALIGAHLRDADAISTCNELSESTRRMCLAQKDRLAYTENAIEAEKPKGVHISEI